MRVLLLGGTTEASTLSRMLARDPRFSATLSLAGATRTPALPSIAHRIGGFGGVDGLADWLRGQRVEALVDATHPYAVQMSRHAAIAAARVAIPWLRIDRPAWTARPGDRWTSVHDAEAAAAALGDTPRRVLLTVGGKALPPFGRAPAHHYLVRCIDRPDPALLPPHAELLLARGPFQLDAEIALLMDRRIELLVSKNSGGAATAPKLEAARRLGLPVLMIDRPPPAGDGSGVTTAADALRWLSARRHDRAPRGA